MAERRRRRSPLRGVLHRLAGHARWPAVHVASLFLLGAGILLVAQAPPAKGPDPAAPGVRTIALPGQGTPPASGFVDLRDGAGPISRARVRTGRDDPPHGPASREVPEIAEADEPPAPDPAPGAPSAELVGPPPPSLSWRELPIRSGDSLARIFQREGLSAGTLHRIVNAGPETARLTRIHPGQSLAIARDQTGRVMALRLEISRLEKIDVRLRGDGYETERIVREPEVRTLYAEGRIDSSLFLAGRQAGLSDALVMALAGIFQWDVDFVLDIRRGDTFRVVYETRWLDGERIGDGPILSAEFVNRGDRHVAVRYEDEDGYASYYAPDGAPMRKAFLRAPVEFSRISSSFNPRRLHPVTRTIRPHRGIDYAAPTGTPVLAAGDGKVLRARRHRYNGNFVVLQHGEEYQTKYLHLSGFGRGIKEGRRVRQGQVIGYVGSTGLATGPHLHYEFLVHGVHRNPRTVPLPRAVPVAAEELPRFRAQTGPRLTRLEQFAALTDRKPEVVPGS